MRAWLSLGSNLGDRAGQLRLALRALARWPGIRLRAVSHGYDTPPWGVESQPPFLNAAAEIETVLTPLELLNVAKGIERRLGRTAGARWGPRIIDIDLVLYEGETVTHPLLTLPHPGLRERAFVLVPLAEIAPDLRDPQSGETMRRLARRVDGADAIAVREAVTP